MDLSVRVNHKKTFCDLWREYRWLTLAFAIPFTLMWICFAVGGVYPFGDRQILVVDGWHQYYPYLVELQSKLQNGQSLLYTWNNGMGTNFLSLAAYYCISPLNFLTLLVPAEGLRIAFAMLVAVKIGLAGLFCAIALRGINGKNGISVTVFGCFYAFCAFFMGYFWNIMWLDTVALLPLVALGTLSLVREGKFKLYVISLALALISNFAIGLYVCIFTFFAFFALCFACKVSRKELLKRFVQIGVWTVAALSLTAFLLLPTYLALGNAYSALGTFPSKWNLHESFLDFFASFAAFSTPTKTDGLPNLYCGLPCVLLGARYAVMKKIPMRQRIAALGMLVLLILSLNINKIEFIWNGFHVTNMLPYRFSFLISFVLIVMAFQASDELFALTKKELIPMGAATVILTVLAYLTHGGKVALWNAAFLLCYLAIVAVRALVKLGKWEKPLSVLLCLILLGEIAATAVIGTKAVGTSQYSVYPKDEAEIKALLDRIEESDDSFYRLECVPQQTLNDPSLLGYRGLSTFSSVANANVSRLMVKMGVAASAAGNRYYNTYLSSPLNNALFGLKYFLVKDRAAEDAIYLDMIDSQGDVTAYRNTASLPIGFMTESAMTNEIPDDENVFRRQNAVFTSATGVEDDMFDLLDIIHVDHRGFKVGRKRLGVYTYEPTDESGDGSMKYNYQMPRSGQLYVYVRCDEATQIKVSCDETEKARYNITVNRPYFFCAGTFEEGTLANISWELKDVKQKQSQMEIFVAVLNEEVFDEGYALLADEGLSVTAYDETSLSGTIEVKEEGYFYTSIPYEAGWTLFVDGKETQITPYQNAFIGMEGLTPGTHTIELRYVPAGFKVGALITVAGLLFFLGACLWERKKKRNT